MKTGIYRYQQMRYGIETGNVVLKVSEMPKSYCFELLEDTTKYDFPHLSMLFRNTNKIYINKQHGSGHALSIWGDNESFTIYPYREGIPFYFTRIGDKITI